MRSRFIAQDERGNQCRLPAGHGAGMPPDSSAHGHDTSVIDYRRRTETPMLYDPKHGDHGECRLCNKPIVFGGERWKHSDGVTYRHTPTPKLRIADYVAMGYPPACPVCEKGGVEDNPNYPCPRCGWQPGTVMP